MQRNTMVIHHCLFRGGSIPFPIDMESFRVFVLKVVKIKLYLIFVLIDNRQNELLFTFRIIVLSSADELVFSQANELLSSLPLESKRSLMC